MSMTNYMINSGQRAKVRKDPRLGLLPCSVSLELRHSPEPRKAPGYPDYPYTWLPLSLNLEV